MNPHGDPKMERICNICGVMYSEVITKECPLCNFVNLEYRKNKYL